MGGGESMIELLFPIIFMLIGFLLGCAFNKSQNKIESEHYLNSPEDDIEERRR